MVHLSTELHCKEGVVELAHDDNDGLYVFASNGARPAKLSPYEAYLLASDIMVWLSQQNVSNGMSKT